MNKYQSLRHLKQTYVAIEREQNNICYWLETGVLSGPEYDRAQKGIDLDLSALLDDCDRHDAEHGLIDGCTSWAIVSCD